MKKLIMLAIMALSSGCGQGFEALDGRGGVVGTNPVDKTVYFPVASATINVMTHGDLALMKKQKPSIMDLIIPKAYAQVAQGSATVSVVYNNPSATVFQVNTAGLGSSVTVSGNDLNLGSFTVSGLDDNTLRVCSGAPANRCNRLVIRVYTLGTAMGGITNTAGFINTDGVYGIDVFAGTVTTPLGFNSSPTASAVTNAANVYEFTIPNGTNRIRLSQLSIPSVPVKADLSNAGNGRYEMNLVVQYALAYVP